MTENDVRELLNHLYDTRRQISESIAQVNKYYEKCASPLMPTAKKRRDELSAACNAMVTFYNHELGALREQIKLLETQLFDLSKSEETVMK